MLGFSTQLITIQQMQKAIKLAYYEGLAKDRYDEPDDPFVLENISYIICEAANLNLIEVIAALQRLKEWEDSQRDHP